MADNHVKLKSFGLFLAVTVFIWFILAVVSAIFRAAIPAIIFASLALVSLVVSLLIERRVFGKRNGA